VSAVTDAEPEPAVADPEKQLAWERRHRARAGFAGILAGVALLVFNVLQQVVNRDAPTTSGLEALQRGASGQDVDALPSLQVPALEHLADRSGEFIVMSVAGFIGYLALGWMVAFVGVAARSRVPTLRRFLVYLPIIGGVLLAVGILVSNIGSLVAINDLLDNTKRTVADAYDARRTGAVLYAGLLSFLGSLATAVGVILVALNAMRAGLLTRMLGYIGIASGAMMVLFSLPIVQVFWLVSVGVLLLGRWPGGELPAWTSGVAVPWPTPERPPPRQRRGAPAPAPEPAPSSGPAPARRKRKKRN
jgi:hypothetical protein